MTSFDFVKISMLLGKQTNSQAQGKHCIVGQKKSIVNKSFRKQEQARTRKGVFNFGATYMRLHRLYVI